MMKKPYALQLVLKNGTHVTIGVEDYNEYLVKKKQLTRGFSKFVDLATSCTVRKKDVSLVEFISLYREESNDEN